MYDPHDLHPNDVTSSAWAIAHARRFLADTESPFEFSQAEILAMLTAHAFTHDETVYYRPHVTAAALIASDPNRATAEWLLSAKVEGREPAIIAREIRASGAWIDDLIETAAGARPRSGRTLTPVF